MVKPKLVIATRSPGKRREIRQILADLPYAVVFPDEIGLSERPEEGGLEEAESFEGNAIRKADYFARVSRLPTAADDSGLEVFALAGKPGVRSRRFALYDGPPEGRDAANNEELLHRLAGLPPDERRARYRCVVAYVASPGVLPVTFEGACTGAILAQPSGTGGFGYDPLFLSDDLGVSFGEADPAEKDRVSHRGRAFGKLAAYLQANPAGR